MKVLIVCIACLILGTSWGYPFSSRVIGGGDVLAHRFPYQISIQSSIYDNQHRCGGAIISPTWIITAAHCVGVSLLVSRIVAGAFNLSNIDQNNAVQLRNIDLYNVIVHPDYNTNDIANDIAVIKVTEPFEFNEYVKPLQISKVSCVASDEINIFSGWGIRDPNNNNLNDVLQTGNMSIISYEDCHNLIYPVYGSNLPVQKDIHICVQGDAAPCVLDEGGPLVQDNRLIGLLSWLPSTCSDKTIPAIFTNTGYYKNFIKEYVDDLS